MAEGVDSQESFLKIGDVVLLSSIDFNGFVGCWYCTPRGSFESQLGLEEIDEQTKNRPTLTTYGSLLEVTHRFNFEAAQEKARLQERAKLELGRVPNVEEDELDDAASEEAEGQEEGEGESLEKALRRAVKNARKEREQNEEDLAKRRGKYVTQGAVIQLRHVATGCFLTVSEDVSKKDPGALSVGITNSGNSRSHLRLLCAYSGDEAKGRVRFHDSVTLQVASIPDVKIEIGRQLQDGEDTLARLNSSSHAGTRRLGVSRKGSPFQLVRWQSAGAVKDPQQVQKSGEVRIVHGETGMTLKADSYGKVEFATIGASECDHSSLWQIVSNDIEGGGDPLGLNEKLRLRHALTGKQLAVENGTIVLNSDAETEWKLRALTREQGENKPARLGLRFNLLSQHGEGLTLGGEPSLGPGGVSPVQCGVTRAPTERDGFIFETDSQRNDVAGLATSLKVVTAALTRFANSVEKAEKPAAALQARSGWVEARAEELRLAAEQYGQIVKDIGREMGALNAALKALASLDKIDGERADSKAGDLRQKVGKSLHATATALCKGNTKNKESAEAYLSVVCGHLGQGFGAGDTLVAILRGNTRLLASMKEDRLRSFVQLVRDLQPRDAVHLDFLAELCGTSDQPIPANQATLVKEVLGISDKAEKQEGKEADDGPTDGGGSEQMSQNREDTKPLLIPIQWEEGKATATVGDSGVDVSRFAGTIWDRSLASYGEWPNEVRGSEAGIDTFRYACAQLNLLRSLCLGSNLWVEESLLERAETIGADFRTLLRCAGSKNVPLVMRAAALDVVLVLHARPSVITPPMPKAIRVPKSKEDDMERLETKGYACRLTIGYDEAAELADTLASALGEDGKLENSDGGIAVLVATALKGCLQLLRGGEKALTERLKNKGVTNKALDLVDGRYCHKAGELRRFSEIPEPVARAKVTALAVADHERRQRLEEGCKLFFDRFFVSEHDGEYTDVANKIESILADTKERFQKLEGPAIDCMRHEDSTVAESGLKRLITSLLGKEELIYCAKSARVIRKDREFRLLQSVFDVMLQVKESLSRVGAPTEAGKEDPWQQCERVIGEAASLLTVGAEFDGEPLRVQDTRRVGEIMASIGFVSLCITLLELPLPTEPPGEGESLAKPVLANRRDLFAKTCRCLELAVEGSAENCFQALGSLDLLASLLEVEGFGFEAAGACTAILRAHPPALKSQQGTEIARRIFGLALKQEKNRAHSLVDAASRLCVVNGRPVEPIQEELMEVVARRERPPLTLLKGDEGRSRFDELLAKRDHCVDRGESSELAHHFASVRLLGSTCSGGASVTATLRAADFIGYQEAGRWILRRCGRDASIGSLRMARAIYLEYMGNAFFDAKAGGVLHSISTSVWPVFAKAADIVGPSGSQKDIHPGNSIVDLLISECRSINMTDEQGSEVRASAEGELSAFEFVSRASKVLAKYFRGVYEQNQEHLPPEHLLRVKTLASALDHLITETKRIQGNNDETVAATMQEILGPVVHLRKVLPDTGDKNGAKEVHNVVGQDEHEEEEGLDRLGRACMSLGKGIRLRTSWQRSSRSEIVAEDLLATKEMAKKLATPDGDGPVPGSQPAQEWRSVVKHMCRLLMSAARENWSDLEVQGAVRLLRASLRIDAGIPEDEIELDGKEEAMASRALSIERLHWAQRKYSELGADIVALRLASKWFSREQGLKLGVDLLSGGNLRVQRRLKGEIDRMERKGEAVKVLGIFPGVKSLMADVGSSLRAAVAQGERAMPEVETCRLTLRLIHLFCEGRETPLKRVIPASTIHELVRFLDRHASEDVHEGIVRSDHGNEELVECFVQSVDTAAEMVTGPMRANKEAFVIRENILVVLNRFLLFRTFAAAKQAEQYNRLRIRIAVLRFLFSLLEGRMMAKEVVERFVEGLNLQAIVDDMELAYNELQSDQGKEYNKLLESDIQWSYCLLARLADMRIKESARLSHFQSLLGVTLSDNIADWLKGRMAVIEVDIGNSDVNVERIDFPLPQECRALMEDRHWLNRADAHMRDIPRKNVKEKATKLQKRMEDLETDICIDQHVRSSCTALTKSLLNFMHIFQALPFYISVVGIILLIIFYQKGRDDFESKTGAHTIFGILAAAQIASSGVLAYLTYLRDCPAWVAKKFRGKEHKNSESEQGREKKGKTKSGRVHPSHEGRGGGGIHDLPHLDPPPHGHEHDEPEIRRLPSLLWMRFLFTIIFFATSILAFLGFLDVAGANAELFIAVPLASFFVLFDAGRVVLDAVILAGPRLLRNAVVAIFLSVSFGLITFTSFRDKVNDISGLCNTAYNCVGESLQKGWILASISGVLTPEGVTNLIPLKIENNSVSQIRIFLVFVYWVAWNLIVLNVFAALLLDGFGTIRGTMISREEDEQAKCLVCSLSKKHFDNSIGHLSFNRHTRHEHWRVNYVFFLQHLANQRRSELTGAEQKVQAKRRNRQLFLPLEEANPQLWEA